MIRLTLQGEAKHRHLLRVPDTDDILKTKEQKPWNNTKHIFPSTKNKEHQRDLLFYVICVQHTKFWLKQHKLDLNPILGVVDKAKIGEVKAKL